MPPKKIVPYGPFSTPFSHYLVRAGVPSPAPYHVTKTPVLVEWDGKTAIVHREGGWLYIPWDSGSQVVQLGGMWFRIQTDAKTGEKKLEQLSAPPHSPLTDFLDKYDFGVDE